ncbi:MAG: hypothetical protein M3Q03_06490 [Chloroflexota bacterium]|nr:hypothetical protein [Chloroflexota bacterium]
MTVDSERGDCPVDLLALPAESRHGPPRAHRGEDLNVNLVVCNKDVGVGEPVNDEIEVLLGGVTGEGVVTVDDHPRTFRPGHLLVVRKGARRATRGAGGRFAYLSCHQRRAELQPTPRGMAVPDAREISVEG